MPGEVATAYEQVTRNMVENLERRFDEHEELQMTQFAEIKQDIREIRQAVEEIKNGMGKRLPPWGTVVFSLLTFIAGLLASVAVR